MLLFVFCLMLLHHQGVLADVFGKPVLRCNVSAVELHHYTQPDRPPYVTRVVRKSRFAALERTRERTFCIHTPMVLTITNPYQWVDCAVCPSQHELNEALLNEAKREFEVEMAAHDAELTSRTERALNQWYRFAVVLPFGVTAPVVFVMLLVCICDVFTRQQQQQQQQQHAYCRHGRVLNEVYAV